jgi:hypothetical protein
MSYNITKSNTVTIGTIADGTYDNTATSLTLVVVTSAIMVNS